MKFQRFLPEGFVYLLNYWERFGLLEYPPYWAMFRNYRQALDVSRIELMPKKYVDNFNYVIDVGANVGLWSIAIAKLTNAKKIIAFEPVPSAFDQMVKNTKKYPNIFCINSAVGSTNNDLVINAEFRSGMSSVLTIRDTTRQKYGMDKNETYQVNVPMVALDEELKDIGEISLLKVDVQGYEIEVFKGAENILNNTRILMTEVTYKTHYYGDQQIMDYLNYIQSVTNFRLWVISTPNFDESGIPLSADAIFIQDL